MSHRHGFSECSLRSLSVNIRFTRNGTIVHFAFRFLIRRGHFDSWLAMRSQRRTEKSPCPDLCSRTIDRCGYCSPGAPKRTPGLVPSLVHSAFSAFPLRSMHATISRWLLDVCRHRRRRSRSRRLLREKNPAYAYTVDGGSYVPVRFSGSPVEIETRWRSVNNGL